jgi:hypothetical protein
MISTNMESIIHYRHEPDEMADLALAVEPMMTHIKAVGSYQDRGALKAILGGEFFRAGTVSRVKSMLIRAVKHARANLHEVFPIMQQEVLLQAQALEDATVRYGRRFATLRDETLPVH